MKVMPKTLESHINKNFELNYVNNPFDYFYKPLMLVLFLHQSNN